MPEQPGDDRMVHLGGDYWVRPERVSAVYLIHGEFPNKWVAVVVDGVVLNLGHENMDRVFSSLGFGDS